MNGLLSLSCCSSTTADDADGDDATTSCNSPTVFHRQFASLHNLLLLTRPPLAGGSPLNHPPNHPLPASLPQSTTNGTGRLHQRMMTIRAAVDAEGTAVGGSKMVARQRVIGATVRAAESRERGVVALPTSQPRTLVLLVFGLLLLSMGMVASAMEAASPGKMQVDTGSTKGGLGTEEGDEKFLESGGGAVNKAPPVGELEEDSKWLVMRVEPARRSELFTTALVKEDGDSLSEQQRVLRLRCRISADAAEGDGSDFMPCRLKLHKTRESFGIDNANTMYEVKEKDLKWFRRISAVREYGTSPDLWHTLVPTFVYCMEPLNSDHITVDCHGSTPQGSVDEVPRFHPELKDEFYGRQLGVFEVKKGATLKEAALARAGMQTIPFHFLNPGPNKECNVEITWANATMKCKRVSLQDITSIRSTCLHFPFLQSRNGDQMVFTGDCILTRRKYANMATYTVKSNSYQWTRNFENHQTFSIVFPRELYPYVVPAEEPYDRKTLIFHVKLVTQCSSECGVGIPDVLRVGTLRTVECEGDRPRDELSRCLGEAMDKEEKARHVYVSSSDEKYLSSFLYIWMNSVDEPMDKIRFILDEAAAGVPTAGPRLTAPLNTSLWFSLREKPAKVYKAAVKTGQLSRFGPVIKRFCIDAKISFNPHYWSLKTGPPHASATYDVPATENQLVLHLGLVHSNLQGTATGQVWKLGDGTESFTLERKKTADSELARRKQQEALLKNNPVFVNGCSDIMDRQSFKKQVVLKVTFTTRFLKMRSTLLHDKSVDK